MTDLKRPNFGGPKMKTASGYKLRVGLKDALAAIANHFETSETEILEAVLDDGLKLLVDKYNIEVKRVYEVDGEDTAS